MTSSSERAPDFLVIGAAKAGTTWLARCLEAHPQVHFAPREIHYFSRHFDRGRSWYHDHFERDAGLRGERSNTYLYHPDAPHRINEHSPRTKLITMVRNPVDRAYSDYCMHAYRGPTSDIGSALRPTVEPTSNLFLLQGCYDTHLHRFDTLFGRDQHLVLCFDDLASTPLHVYAQVCEFLELDASVSAPPRGAANARRSRRPPTWLSRLAAEGRLGGVSRWPSPAKGLLRRLVRAVSKKVNYPQLDGELRGELIDYFEPEVRALENRLGRTLPDWRSNPPN